jgi:hypothetical protein
MGLAWRHEQAGQIVHLRTYPSTAAVRRAGQPMLKAAIPSVTTSMIV